MQRGRKPGYKHSEETKAKISKSLSGRPKSVEHRDALSDSKHNLERKCMLRFLELRSQYPEHKEFFDANKSRLLFAMRTIKSEKELRDIRKHIESISLEDVPPVSTSYQYESSSCYAQEDAMIALIDAMSFLEKVFSTNKENNPIH